MIKLIACKPMPYGTRMLAIDEPLEAPEREARMLVALGKARYADPSTDLSASTLKITKGRRYDRRDMRAA